MFLHHISCQATKGVIENHLNLESISTPHLPVHMMNIGFYNVADTVGSKTDFFYNFLG